MDRMVLLCLILVGIKWRGLWNSGAWERDGWN